MRAAHEAVGKLVRLCEERRCRLADLPAGVYESVRPGLAPGVYKVLGVANALAAFRSVGSTAPAEVERQLACGAKVVWQEPLTEERKRSGDFSVAQPFRAGTRRGVSMLLPLQRLRAGFSPRSYGEPLMSHVFHQLYYHFVWATHDGSRVDCRTAGSRAFRRGNRHAAASDSPKLRRRTTCICWFA